MPEWKREIREALAGAKLKADAAREEAVVEELAQIFGGAVRGFGARRTGSGGGAAAAARGAARARIFGGAAAAAGSAARR